jgi:N-acetylmuramoyl-L-alanine amidase
MNRTQPTRIQRWMLPIFACLLAFAAPLPAPNGALPPEELFLEVKAMPRDDIPTLLKRYGLHDYACNLTQFFKINNLKQGHRLKLGAWYKIPVLVVPYDGRSIRSTLQINDWQQAVRIRDYNLDALSKNWRKDNFTHSKQLWVPWHELHCDEQVTEGEIGAAEAEAQLRGEAELSPQGNSGVFPIFGPKYQKTPRISNKLAGRAYYVISGHGGPDVGAQGTRAGHSLCEDEYAYDVSLRLVRLLVSHGASVYLIVRDPDDGIRDEAYLECDKDEFVWGNRVIPDDQKARLGQRVELVNTLYRQHLKAGLTEQTLIEIHVDSRTRHQRIDAFFYHRLNGKESEDLAKKIHKTFFQKYAKIRAGGRYSGTVSGRDLYTLRETEVPRAVYVELANIRNEWDQQRLVVTSNRQALANWLFQGLTAK